MHKAGTDENEQLPAASCELAAGGLTMVRSNGCFRHLTWRVVERVQQSEADSIAQGMVRRGLDERGGSPLLCELRTTDDDAIVFVPKTGRIDVRLAGARPYPERIRAAQNILNLLAEELKAAQAE